jgi:hypothetical protein
MDLPTKRNPLSEMATDVPEEESKSSENQTMDCCERAEDLDKYPIPVSEAIRHKQREFVYEAMVLLNKCRKRQKGGEENDNDETLHTADDKPTNRLILYRFLALLLVRDKEADVAALAVYHTSEKLQVYWTKNTVVQDDEEHALAIQKLVVDTRACSDDFIERLLFPIL